MQLFVFPGRLLNGSTVALCCLVAVALVVRSLDAAEAGAVGPQSKAAFVFRGENYFHRWSQNEQHEFTPEKQDDLSKWSDMITLNGYPDVREGEGLAAKANAVLENYKREQAMVLKTTSIPRTPERPAEHLIAVVFGRAKFLEVAFARLKLVDGAGCSVVYSHRIYGEKIGDQVSAWLSANGPVIEKALMEWSALPSPKSLKQELLRTRS